VSNNPERLRAQAEAQLAGSVPATTVHSTEALLRELQVRQTELETQNENLRQTQRALEESRDRYRNLYDFSPVAFLTLNRDGLIFEMNYSAASLFGTDCKLLINCDFARYIAAENFKRWHGYFSEILKSNDKHSCEMAIRRGDGSVFPAHLDCMRVEAGNGENTVHVALFDITEQKRAEAELRVSEEKFRSIFEGTRDGIVLVDDTGMIVECNQEFVRQAGMPSEQLKQMRIWEFRPADKVELAKGIFQNALKTGLAGVADFKYKKPDGKVIQVEARGSCLLIGGHSYLKCIVRDITERKSAETELREYQRLLRELAAQGAASREAELKHIAREVHDELGQLLTALRMDISLLRIQFGDDNQALMIMIKDMLVLVDKAIQGVRDVTANLHPPALDMGIVLAITWLAEEFTSRTGVTCDLQFADDQPGLDDTRTLTLFRIVQESLTNIARYAQATHVVITIKSSREDISIEVRDDGKGFDTGAIPAKQSFGLMGMKERALAVCGKVEVTSSPGAGTVVLVDIPLFQTNPGRRVND
jgi:PAS domain S-box-containing protein